MIDEQSTAESRQPRLRWFQFRLRTLFLITAIVAVVFSARGSKWYIQRQRTAYVERLAEVAGPSFEPSSRGMAWWGKSGFKADYEDVPWWSATPRGVEFGGWQVDEQFPSWTQSSTFDDQMLANVTPLLINIKWLSFSKTQVTDAGMKHLAQLTKLDLLDLSISKVTDRGLADLTALTNLQVLDLSDTEVSDTGLAHLQKLTELRVLLLCDTRITDAGLEHLAALTKLEHLDLQGTRLTDAGLERLKSFSGLEYLNIGHTSVTEDGIRRLERALPNTEIEKHGVAYY